jgi:uncharacterized iron-regulated membrane protein
VSLPVLLERLWRRIASLAARLPAPGSEASRRFWLRVHVYLALSLGLLFALLGLTGSLTLVAEAVDGGLDPEPVAERPGRARLPLDDLVAAARAAHPDRENPWTLVLPRNPEAPVTVRSEQPEETLLVAVDPYTGTVAASGPETRGFTALLRSLHAELGAGGTGRSLVGYLGALFAVSVSTGLYLGWWLWRNGPRRPFAPFDHGTFRRWAEFAAKLKRTRGQAGFAFALPRIRDWPAWLSVLHRVAGVGGFAILLIVAVSAFLLVHPGPLAPAEPPKDGTHGGYETLRSLADPGRGPVGLEAAAALARGPYRDARVVRITTPRGPTGTYRVELCRAGESCAHHVSITAWSDQYSGRVLGVDHHADEKGHAALLSWHTGTAWGGLGRLAWFVAGWLPLVLYGSGLWLWIGRRRGRPAG